MALHKRLQAPRAQGRRYLSQGLVSQRELQEPVQVFPLGLKAAWLEEVMGSRQKRPHAQQLKVAISA